MDRVTPAVMRSREQQCSRYGRSGERCHHRTSYRDGWCREPDCPGFTRPSTAEAPGPARWRGGVGRVATSTVVDDADFSEVSITRRAINQFVDHHATSAAEAEAQLRSMLEDFFLNSELHTGQSGVHTLSNRGYALALDSDFEALISYRTVHRERTWAQLKAGVRSRFRRKRTRRSGPAFESGPGLELDAFLEDRDASSVFVAWTARRAFTALTRAEGTDEEIDEAVRAGLGEAYRHGSTQQLDSGRFAVDHGEHAYVITADGGCVVFVMQSDTGEQDSSVDGRVPPEASAGSAHEDLELADG